MGEHRRDRDSSKEYVEKLTNMAEAGDKSGLNEEFHRMHPDERAHRAHQIDQCNAEHRKSNAQLPDVTIVTTHAFGVERLDDILTAVPNDTKAWYKPWTWFQGSEITKDVYDPDFDEAGNGLLQKVAELLIAHRRQIEEARR
ncbi:MAG: hypothetical protein HY711_00610 [Candidatus Melainabacteria bacterium]|nr:hypothetical protein [Candidatus Melainabacteria bacterium]